MPRVLLADDAPDIVDIYLMSRSRVLMTSIRSTFSYWSAFLSDGHVIRAPYPGYVPIRGTGAQAFEGDVSQFAEFCQLEAC